MASSAKYVVFLVVLLAVSATANLSPNNSPNFGDICREVDCGKGSCEATLGSKVGFKCKCEAGWSRTRPNQEDFDFLPCIIPNCSLDYSCMPAAPPAPSSFPINESVFDPCYYAYCGEGKCSKNLTYGLTCQCNPGYSNLLNNTAFPCYSECALGSDCERLGINVSRSSSNNNDNNYNQATSFLPGNFHWIGIMLITALLAVRN